MLSVFLEQDSFIPYYVHSIDMASILFIPAYIHKNGTFATTHSQSSFTCPFISASHELYQEQAVLVALSL